MSEDSLMPVGLDRARLFAAMAERSLDAILFSSPENVFYTTGYPCLPSSGNPIVYALRNQLPFFSFVEQDGPITLLAWGAASMGIDYGADEVRPFFMRQMAIDEVVGLFEEKLRPGCTVGVESTFPFNLHRLLQEHAQPGTVVVVDDLIHRLRLIKSRAEIERIRRSTEIVERTVLELAESLLLGMGRLELIQEAKTRLVMNGAQGIDHITVAFGSANPEVALNEKLEEDQIVTLDLGAFYGGYASDNRRLIYTGAVPASLRRFHQKLCRIVAAVGDMLRPGNTFGDVYAHALELYEQEDLPPLFLHAGHSIGLQVEEQWIVGEDPTQIEPGMVLNVELYSFSDEAVMIGDEETYVVTDGEPVRISRLPVELIEHRFS
jgi:Xaa-Pro dipeptidase